MLNIATPRKIKSNKVHWISDVLVESREARDEISDFNSTNSSTKVAQSNVAEICISEFSISNTMQKVKNIGQNETDYQKIKNAKIHAKNLEMIMWGLGRGEPKSSILVQTPQRD